MFKKWFLSTILIFHIVINLPFSSFAGGIICGNGGGAQGKVASRVKPLHLNPEKKDSLGEVRSFNLSQKRVSPKQVTAKRIYQNTIEGNWDYVVGQIGFYHEFEGIGKAFVSIFGIGTYDEGNGVYSTEDWDRQAFWLEVGDGVPLHLAVEFYGEFEEVDDPNSTFYVYYGYNLLYRQNGVDYTGVSYDGFEFGGIWIDFELITDPENNYLDHNIYIYDENGELVDERKLEIGDQVQSNTAMFDLDDPETIWVATMDEEFHTVQDIPLIYYKHLTPNVDFPNEKTLGLIDFSNVDLQLVLLGVNEGENDILFNYPTNPFQYSSVIDMGLKWDDVPSTSVMDWFLSFF